jgi:hypothetical protein
LKTAKDILQHEVNLIIEDIIQLYEGSGKKTSGQFAEGLSMGLSENKVELFGYAYLLGRKAGQMPPVEKIKQWVLNKGIASVDAEASGIAWAIAKKISREGTKQSSSLPIYDMVITPERMDKIIAKVSEFHAEIFVQEVTTRIMKISEKYN